MPIARAELETTWTAHGAVVAPLSCDSPAASSPGFTQRTQQPSTFSSALTISFPLCTPAWFPLPHIAQDSPMLLTPRQLQPSSSTASAHVAVVVSRDAAKKQAALSNQERKLSTLKPPSGLCALPSTSIIPVCLWEVFSPPDLHPELKRSSFPFQGSLWGWGTWQSMRRS